MCFEKNKFFYIFFIKLFLITFAKTNQYSFDEKEIELNESNKIFNSRYIDFKQDKFSVKFDNMDKDKKYKGSVWNSFDMTNSEGLKISFNPVFLKDSNATDILDFSQYFEIILKLNSIKNKSNENNEINNTIIFRFNVFFDSMKENNEILFNISILLNRNKDEPKSSRYKSIKLINCNNMTIIIII